ESPVRHRRARGSHEHARSPGRPAASRRRRHARRLAAPQRGYAARSPRRPEPRGAQAPASRQDLADAVVPEAPPAVQAGMIAATLTRDAKQIGVSRLAELAVGPDDHDVVAGEIAE